MYRSSRNTYVRTGFIPMIQHYGFIKKGYKWTQAHHNELYRTLQKILPIEIINLINNYCKKFKLKDLCWIPFEPQKKWNANDVTVFINCETTVRIYKKDINNKTNIKLYFVEHNYLMSKNGNIQRLFQYS